MLRSARTTFVNYLMLSDTDGTFNDVERWRISALRIMLITAYFFYSFIAIHCVTEALEVQRLYVLPVIVSFYIFGGITLLLSKSHYYISAYSFLFSIVMAAVCINLLVKIPTLAMLGPVFIFSLPLIAFILLGNRAGIICSLANILPFLALLNGFQLNQYVDEQPELESASAYIFSIIFLFFNVSIPLAVARAKVATSRLTQKITKQNISLQLQNDFYQTLFVETDIAKLLVNNLGVVTEMNFAAQELLDCNFKQLAKPIRIKHIFSDVPSDEGTSIINLPISGKTKVFKVSRSSLFNETDYFLTIQDITAKTLLHKTLAAQTLLNKKQKVDDITRLPNRLWLETQIDNLIASHPENLSVIAIQINNAQFIEQKHGFQTLPIVMHKLANQFLSQANVSSSVASADLNHLVIACLYTPQEAKTFTSSFVGQLPKTFTIEHSVIPIDVRVGIACSDSSEDKPEKLVRNALYAANSGNLIINFYQSLSLERFIEHQEVNILLHEAITNNELYILYQPKVKADGQLIGLEALMRWSSPIVGNVSPAVFIPIAEKSGLITSLTQWLISAVCKQLNEWQQQGGQLVPVAINISGADLDDDHFHEYLFSSLLKHKIGHQLIELELTESARSVCHDKALSTLNYLENWGFDISLDDFGIGYSGLSKLISYPVKKVKIDRKFVQNIDCDEQKARVVEAIVAMCKVFDIEILAEGVEKFSEVNKLIELGCHNFQGYVFSKPMQPSNINYLLTTQNVLESRTRKILAED